MKTVVRTTLALLACGVLPTACGDAEEINVGGATDATTATTVATTASPESSTVESTGAETDQLIVECTFEARSISTAIAATSASNQNGGTEVPADFLQMDMIAWFDSTDGTTFTRIRLDELSADQCDLTDITVTTLGS